MRIIYLIQLITFVFNLSLGVFVLRKNFQALANRAFAIFTVAAAFWVLSIFIILSSSLQVVQLWVGRAGIAFGSVAAAGLLLFSLVFPGESENLTWKKRAITLCAVIFSIIPFFMVRSVTVLEGSIVGTFNWLQFLWLTYILFCFAYPFFAILYKHYKIPCAKKAGTQYVILGFLSFIIPLIFLNIVMPNIFGIFKYNELGPAFTIPMVLFISYAILKHGFLDIRVIVQKGLIYTLLLAIIIGTYLSLTLIAGFFMSVITNFTILFSAGVTMVLGIFGAPVLERYFERVTDRIFFKNKYDYREALYELSEILNKNLDLNVLLHKTTECLKKIFKTSGARILLGEEAGSDNPLELSVPINMGKKKIGVLLMEPKLSGDPYSVEDEKLLQIFSYQAGVAFEKAKLYNQALRHNDELEERVVARTAKIQKMQEEQKRMMLDISHGLQTPLTVMKIELGALKKQVQDQTSINLLIKSINDISKFIYDLLSLSRLESGGESIKKEKVDLSRLMNELAEYLEVILEAENVKLIKDIREEVTVAGNADKLKTLIINLVSNAIKYQDHKKSEKKIRLRLTKTKGETEIQVEDNGLGISKENLPHIFERFFRAKTERDEKVGGAGLGLAICKEIVEQHGGSIDVQSEVDKGTQFTVRLPQ